MLTTVDLKAAYKQFAIQPSQRRACVVSLRDPGGGSPKGFVSHVLPFGALASVGQLIVSQSFGSRSNKSSS